METKLHGNKKNVREFFRVTLTISVYVRKIYYDKIKDRYYYNDWIKLKSKDISGNGIFLLVPEDLKIEKDDYVLIKFDLNRDGNFIYILTRVVRKTEEGIALTYILVDDNKIDSIIREFLQIEHERHIKKSDFL